MELILYRDTLTDESSIGTLWVNGELFSQTLEDLDRGLASDNPLTWGRKVRHQTAIPTGRYEVIMNWSNAFGRRLPLLLRVPAFEGIRIHRGNTPAHTSGCILVGQTRAENFVGVSAKTEQKLVALLDHATRREKVYLSVGYGRGVEDARSVKFPVPVLEPHLPEKA